MHILNSRIGARHDILRIAGSQDGPVIPNAKHHSSTFRRTGEPSDPFDQIAFAEI
jgi:hypothetical protein